MIQAICIRCGTEKLFAWLQCKSCDFKPELGTEDHLKSMYQSKAREALGIPEDLVQADLAQAQKLLRSGKEPAYVQSQIEHIRELGNDEQPFATLKAIGGLVYLLGVIFVRLFPIWLILGAITFLSRWLT